VQVNAGVGSNLNIRGTANGSIVGQQPNGTLGSIIGGGTQAGSFFWWNVNFDSGVDGWAAEDFLLAYTAPPPPTPTPTPPSPTPTPTPPPPVTGAGVYYVAKTGCSNSTSAGTISQPWCTIAYGLGRITSGNTLYVRAGTYNEQLTITGPAGTPAQPTTIAAYPGETVILQGQGGQNGGRQKILNTSYINFRGFKITEWNQGLFIENSNNVHVDGIEVYRVGQEAVHFINDTYNSSIQNSYIHDTRTWQYNGEGIYVGTGGGGGDNSHDILIKNNIITNTLDECIEAKEGTYNVTIDGNTLTNCITSSEITSTNWGAIELMENDGQGAPGNPSHVVKNNVINTSKTAIGVHTGATLFNNVIYGTTGSFRGISMDNPDGDSYPRNVFHNTIDVPSARAVTGSGDIRNNVGPSSTGNLAMNAAYFVNSAGRDYHLVSGAAPINAGASVGIATDKDGAARVAPPDIGAYEFGGVVTPPPPPSPTPTPPPPSPTPTPPPPSPTPPPSTKFSIGDRIITTQSVAVRQTPGGTKLGSQHVNALGVVVAGSTAAGSHVWWQIDYGSGADGWSAEAYLEKYVQPFAVGNRVQTTDGPIGVRNAPAGTKLGSQQLGAAGTVLDGPMSAGSNVWWNVDYDVAPDGWSAEKFLTPSSIPSPTPTPPSPTQPPPSPTPTPPPPSPTPPTPTPTPTPPSPTPTPTPPSPTPTPPPPSPTPTPPSPTPTPPSPTPTPPPPSGGTITMGDPTIYGQTDGQNDDTLVAQNAILAQAGTLQSLSFYVKTAIGQLRLGVYDATGPGGGPGALKAQTDAFTPSVGWNTAAVTPVTLSPGTYWLAFMPSNSGLQYAVDWDSSGLYKDVEFEFGPFPATFPEVNESHDAHWSLYATLTGTSAMLNVQSQVASGGTVAEQAAALQQLLITLLLQIQVLLNQQ
jgi:hypothetical protein